MGPKPPACAALTLLAVAAGWIHEGFSIPMCCGLAVMTVLRKGRVEGTLWLMIAAYLCGTAVAILSPGLWFRAAHVGHSSALPTVRQIARTAATGMPAVIALTVAVTAMSMSRRWRGRISDLLQSNPVAVILAGAIPVSSALSAWTLSPRGGWMAETGAIILAGCLCRWLPKPSRAVRMSVTLFLLAAIATFYGNVISWQYRIKTQDDRLSLLAAESATGTIYYSEPLIVPPPITLGHPYSRFWRNSEVSAERRVADPLHRPISAIPAPLADYDPAQTEPVEGNAGTFYFRDYLLTKKGRRDYNGLWNSFLATATVTTADGRTFDAWTHFKMFTAPNGEIMYLVFPDLPKLEARYVRVDL